MHCVAGSFRDRSLEEDMNRANISEQITVQQGADANSHTAGLEVRPFKWAAFEAVSMAAVARQRFRLLNYATILAPLIARKHCRF